MQLVTIILTTLNSERFLARSIESCLAQSYTHFELLIVDGGSTDSTLEIIASYDDPRIRLLHQKDNAGRLPGALNLGMANARGEFITWTQDDSWYEPHAIERMYEYLTEHDEVGLVYADYWFVDAAGQPFRYQAAGAPEQIADGGDVIGQCFLFRRAVYEAIGPQDERYFPVHEIPWRVRVADSFVIRPLHQALMYYTLHPHSLTGKIGPWPLRYMVAAVLFQDGWWDRRTYRERVAQIHLDHAYDCFVLRANYRQFWKHLFQAAWLAPQKLNNRGLWRLMLASIRPDRETVRQNEFNQWESGEARRLDEWREAAHA